MPDEKELFKQPPPPTISGVIKSFESEDNVKQAYKKKYVNKNVWKTILDETDNSGQDDSNDPDFDIGTGSLTMRVMIQNMTIEPKPKKLNNVVR